MSNEIDLYKDLEDVEMLYKNCVKQATRDGVDIKLCKFWKNERKKVVAEIKEKYPELAL